MIDDSSKNGPNDNTNEFNKTGGADIKDEKNTETKDVISENAEIDDDRKQDDSAGSTDVKTDGIHAGDNGEAPKKLGKVIPFNAEAEAGMAKEAAREAMDDAVRNIKTALNDLKEQLSPLAATLHEVAGVIKESAGEARKNLSTIINDDKIADKKENDIRADENEDADDQAKTVDSSDDKTDDKTEDTDKAETKPESEAVTITRETTAAITEGFNRLRERAANGKLNIANIISNEFDNFADKNLDEKDYTIDEDGKRVVTVNSDFMQAHANELIPAMIRGTVGTFLKTLLGDSILDTKIDDTKKDDTAEDKDIDADAEDSKDDTKDNAGTEDKNDSNENKDDSNEDKDDSNEDKDDSAEDKDDSKYRVQFDFAGTLSDMIRNAKVVNNDTGEVIDDQDMDRSRALLIEGGKLTEDALNGKPIDDAEQRIDKAIEEVDRKYDTDTQRPEDIDAIDEKHRRILEISKQFEQNMVEETPGSDDNK